MDERQYAEWLKANYYTTGSAEATRMTPETEIRYLREQLQHRDRQLEELRAQFEIQGRRMVDYEATIRILVHMCADPVIRFS